MESIVIFGGTFDPIHNGHLRVARAASLLLNADVVFVPARSPRWKKPETTPKQRLEMLQLALKYDGSSSFSIDLFEFKSKAEVNYTIDTVLHFKKKYPKRNLYLLLGADEVNAFPKWKNPEKIAELVTVVYFPRVGVELDDGVLQKFQMRRLAYDGAGEVSSSSVRCLRSMDIPISVRNYIEKNSLYYIKTLSSMISPKRLAHSLSVANLAYGVAVRNKVENYQSAYIAGILHDCAKNYSKEAAVAFMKKNYPSQFPRMPEWTYHQFVGAHLAKSIFGISDEAVLDAIRYHATGKAHMTPIGKIIYASDKIEPTRSYDSSKLIEACFKNYYTGFVNVLEENRIYLKSKGFVIDNPLTAACMKQYLGVK